MPRSHGHLKVVAKLQVDEAENLGTLGNTTILACLIANLVVGWSIYTKVKIGLGLPSGPFGLLGAVEGLSYLTLLAILAVFALQYLDYGYILGPTPGLTATAQGCGDEGSNEEGQGGDKDDNDVGERALANAWCRAAKQCAIFVELQNGVPPPLLIPLASIDRRTEP
eukprot:Gb_29756 [translate_table: standard]